ncbi:MULTISPECIES: LapA family protein [Comamonadaceae]|jgi:uncharacterized integral membrane protein|uniref:LapA family protein n=1 Tax=Comamonas denitrificans TaxID=117506 RepID=UPI000DB3339D|nr:MAG: DUF1049 domain-containing protein [Azospira oryzae]
MRYLYLAIVILMTLVVVTFMVQNSGSATVSLLSSSATLPLSLLTLGTYFLGMLTGGMLIAFIRSLVRGATKPQPNQ